MQNNPILTMLFNQLQMNNPQMYQQLSQLQRNNANPEELIKQTVIKATPQEMQYVLSQAKQLGVPDNILAQIQNMKNR